MFTAKVVLPLKAEPPRKKGSTLAAGDERAELFDVGAGQVLKQVFQPVPIGEGAHQFAGDLGTVDRCGEGAEGINARAAVG